MRIIVFSEKVENSLTDAQGGSGRAFLEFYNILKEKHNFLFLPRKFLLEKVISTSNSIVYSINFLDSIFLPFFAKKVIWDTHYFYPFHEEKFKINKNIFINFGRLIKLLAFLFLSPLIPKNNVRIRCLLNYQYNFFKKLGFKNLFLIPNLISTKYYPYPTKSEKFAVLWIARMCKHKNVLFLYYLLKNFSNNNVRFIIAGYPEDKELYEKLKKLEKEKSNVIVKGSISFEEKVNLLSSSSLFLFTSFTESAIPFAAIESLICGCPILGNDIVSLRELKRINENFVTLSKLSIKEFGRKILEFYEKFEKDREKYYRMRMKIAKEARKYFDIEKNKGKILKLFEF